MRQAEGGAAVPADTCPRTASQDRAVGIPTRSAGRSGAWVDRRQLLVAGAMGVAAPLPDVAVHIVQTPGVGRIRTDDTGPLQVWSRLDRVVGTFAVAVGLGAVQHRAEVKRRARPGAAGIFPL